MALHPKVFGDSFVSSIAAGEASGTLVENFENIAIQLEKEEDLISKIKGAMLYPIVVLSAAFLLGLGLTFMRGLFGSMTERVQTAVRATDITNPPTEDNPLTLTPSKVTMRQGETSEVQVAFMLTNPEDLYIKIMGKLAGVVMTIHPVLLRSFKIKGNLSMAIVDFGSVEGKKLKDKSRYSPLPKFPGSTFDWTVVAPNDAKVQLCVRLRQVTDILKFQ